MAQRRMFSLSVCDTDAFLDLPASSQALYFHLGLRADDDGFVASPKRITAMTNSSADDLKLLVAKGFLIAFPSGVVVVRDWRINNLIQKDRYHQTIYTDERKKLTVAENGSYLLDTSCIQDGNILETEVRLGKESQVSLLSERADSASDEKNFFSSDSKPYMLAKWLDNEIAQRSSHYKRKNEAALQKWANTFDLMYRRDGIDFDELFAVLSFSQSDSFWRMNILSAEKFRKQFLQLEARLHDKEAQNG